MKILVSGTSGLIGSHLTLELEARGHEVCRLVRRATRTSSEVEWDPQTPPQLTGFDAVIHLAGETIMGRWTEQKKARILQSRVIGTWNLSTALVAATSRPGSFLVASAVGYYGPCGSDVLTEDSPPGRDFLSQVAQEWEAASQPAYQAGIRVVNFRTGVVLTPVGGALKRMLTPFRMGAAGRLGSGKQWMSWIALDDVVGATLFALENPALSGPVNLVAPNPVTNAEFTRALGQALHRPTLFPLPAGLVKLALGEMGEALLLSGQRVIPAKLQASGYKFRHTAIGEALRSMLH